MVKRMQRSSTVRRPTATMFKRAVKEAQQISDKLKMHCVRKRELSSCLYAALLMRHVIRRRLPFLKPKIVSGYRIQKSRPETTFYDSNYGTDGRQYACFHFWVSLPQQKQFKHKATILDPTTAAILECKETFIESARLTRKQDSKMKLTEEKTKDARELAEEFRRIDAQSSEHLSYDAFTKICNPGKIFTASADEIVP